MIQQRKEKEKSGASQTLFRRGKNHCSIIWPVKINEGDGIILRLLIIQADTTRKVEKEKIGTTEDKKFYS